jgi:hypothetical protein
MERTLDSEKFIAQIEGIIAKTHLKYKLTY